MQPAKIFKTSSGLFSLLVLFTLGAFYLSSCKDKKKEDVETSCLTLSSTQIQDAWVTPGYTNPGSDNVINYINLQATLDTSSGVIAVTAQGYKMDNTAIGNPVNLKVGTNCPTDLPSVLVGKNLVDMSKLNILE